MTGAIKVLCDGNCDGCELSEVLPAPDDSEGDDILICLPASVDVATEIIAVVPKDKNIIQNVGIMGCN